MGVLDKFIKTHSWEFHIIASFGVFPIIAPNEKIAPIMVYLP